MCQRLQYYDIIDNHYLGLWTLKSPYQPYLTSAFADPYKLILLSEF